MDYFNFKDPICTFCNVGLQVVLLYMSFGATNDEVADLAFLLCMEMEIQERHVCRGLIDIHIVSRTQLIMLICIYLKIRIIGNSWLYRS